MKMINLEVDDSVFNKVMTFLKLLPDKKLKVSELEDYSHIPYVSNEEQNDIEKVLQNKECHDLYHSKTVTV